MSMHERSGWRDPLWINNEHRSWGWNCPIVDLDFIVAEYDGCQPVAIVDYKLRMPNKTTVIEDANWRTLSNLANKAGIAFFTVLYITPKSKDHKEFRYWHFRVNPGNKIARRLLRKHGVHKDRWISKYEYTLFLYHIREHDETWAEDSDVFKNDRYKKTHRSVTRYNKS